MNDQSVIRNPQSEIIRVLLVEDNPGDARLIREMLAEVGGVFFDVAVAKRLSTGLEHLAEGGIDVVLLDLVLPDSRGIDTLAKVQAKAPQVPIVVLTGLGDGMLGVKAVREGAQDYLVKGQVEGNLLVRAMRYAIERKWAEEQIKASLREKEMLLKEVHHRVKNNLQVISSLLRLQSEYVKDKESLEMFKESYNRIRSIASIHEKLYQFEELARIDFAEYIRNITDHLFRSYGVNSEAISLKINVVDGLLGIDTAIPCGLIINELVSNCLKHAFPEGRKGEICIDLSSDLPAAPSDRAVQTGNKFTLIVSDNGVGLPKDFHFRNTRSLGLQLVNTLTDQLRGTIELDGNRGTSFKITFTVTEGESLIRKKSAAKMSSNSVQDF